MNTENLQYWIGLIVLHDFPDCKRLELVLTKSIQLSLYVYSEMKRNDASKQPTINDNHLKIQLVAPGLRKPTSMAFLDNGDIIVLEISNGTVRRIINDTLQLKLLLDVNVSKVPRERGC